MDVLAPPAVELGSFVARAALLGGVPPERAAALARTLLALPEGASADTPWITSSGLNNDGSPLEFCYSSFADACRSRLVCDPASHLRDPRHRHEASLATLERALALTGSADLEPLCRQALAAMLPADLSAYLEGTLWLGAGLGFPGLALYVDATRGTLDERFDRVLAGWRDLLAGRSDAAAAVLERLRPVALPMAFGVEGTAPANARTKLFFRLAHPLALGDLGIDALAHPRFLSFLEATMGAREISIRGLVLSLSFLVATGDLFEAKVDLCGHCLALPAADAARLVTGLATTAGLVPPPVVQLADSEAEIAFLGLARSPLGERLDVFLKTPTAGLPGAGAGRFHG